MGSYAKDILSPLDKKHEERRVVTATEMLLSEDPSLSSSFNSRHSVGYLHFFTWLLWAFSIQAEAKESKSL